MKGTRYMLIGVARSRGDHLFAGHLSLCRDRTALRGLKMEGDTEHYLLKIASAEVLHLIKPGGPEKHLQVLPALQPASYLISRPTARTQGVSVQIHRLWDSQGPQGDRGSGGGTGEASVSLWTLGTEPEQESRRLNSAANVEERRHKRNPTNGAEREDRSKRRRGRDLL